MLVPADRRRRSRRQIPDTAASRIRPDGMHGTAIAPIVNDGDAQARGVGARTGTERIRRACRRAATRVAASPEPVA